MTIPAALNAPEVMPTPANWPTFAFPVVIAEEMNDGGVAIPTGALTIVSDRPTIPAPTTLPALRQRSPINDFYNNIFINPGFYNLQNPPLDSPFLYDLWNAYLEPGQDNTLNTIVATGATGLDNSLTPPLVFSDGEFKEGFSITITTDAPNTIAAVYDFQFTNGSTTFNFNAVISIVFDFEPEVPLREIYNFGTNILKAYDGTEQRISTLRNPRKSLAYTIVIEDEAGIQKLKDILMFNTSQLLQYPIWTEPYDLTADATTGSNVLQMDLTLSDIQVDDTLFITKDKFATVELHRVTSKSDTQVELLNNLENDYEVGRTIVYQLDPVYTDPKSSFKRKAYATGQMSVKLESEQVRSLFGYGGNLTTYESIPVLPTRHLANRDLPERFETKQERIDTDNKFIVYDSQAIASVEQQRDYLITDRQQMQDFKLFLQTVAGSRNIFLSPTWRADLNLQQQPAVAASVILIKSDPDYANIWYNSVSFRRLQLITGSGIRYYTVEGVVDNLDGTQTVSISPPLENTVEGSTIELISFLESMRIADDKAEFIHEHRQSFLRMRTVGIQQEDIT